MTTLERILQIKHGMTNEQYYPETITAAVKEWLQQKQNLPEDWSPSKLAKIGAKRIIKELLKELEQQ